MSLYLEVDGEPKGFRQVKCEAKQHELEILLSSLLDPIGRLNRMDNFQVFENYLIIWYFIYYLITHSFIIHPFTCSLMCSFIHPFFRGSEFLCQSVSLTSQCKDQLDEKLTQSFLANIPKYEVVFVCVCVFVCIYVCVYVLFRKEGQARRDTVLTR